MTRDGIYKLRMRKQASGLTDSAALLGTLAALGIVIPSFAGGWALGKWTSPRDTDMSNLQRESRLARLRGDREQLLLQQQQLAQNQKNPTDAKKSVYGLVNA